MIKAVLFDLDGTLLNRDDSLELFIENQYERLKKWVGHIPKDQYKTRFIKLDNRGYVWKDKVYEQLVREFDIIGITQERLLQDYITQFKNHCVPFPNLHTMLKQLRESHIKLGIITNGKGQFQFDNIKALGIDSYFDTILVSEWEGIKKPNPQIFEKALKQLSIDPNESVFVGDHPDNDVKAAQQIGMKGIWKKDRHGTNVGADFIITDLMELPVIIKKLN